VLKNFRLNNVRITLNDRDISHLVESVAVNYECQWQSSYAVTVTGCGAEATVNPAPTDDAFLRSIGVQPLAEEGR
jgi:hypothetical protein